MGRRRYAVPLHPIYSRTFDHLKGKSPLLNPSAKCAMDGITLSLGDRAGVEDLIAEYKGKVAKTEQAITAIEEKFSNMQTVAKREGQAVPTELPPELVETQLMLEAKMDVRLEEIDALQKLLKNWIDREQRIKKEQILFYGPQGSGSLRDGILKELDGQDVTFNAEKDCLCIDCPTSPYHGMPTAAYYVMVKAWKKERGEALNHAMKQSRNMALTEAERTEWFNKCRLTGPVPSSQWPPRPEGT